VHTDELEDDVNASDLGDLIECCGLVGGRTREVVVVLARSRDGNHVRAQRVRDLDARCRPAVEPDIKDSFAASNEPGHERVVGGCEGFGNPPPDPTDVIRDEEQMFTSVRAWVAWARHQRCGRLFARGAFVYPFTAALTTPASSIPGTSAGQPSGRVVAVALHEVGRVIRHADRDDGRRGGRDGGLALLEFEVSIVDDDAAHPCSLRRAALHDDR